MAETGDPCPAQLKAEPVGAHWVSTIMDKEFAMNPRLAMLLAAIGLALVTGCSATKSGVNAEASGSGAPRLEATQVASADVYVFPGNPRGGMWNIEITQVPETLPRERLLDFKDVPDYSNYDMLVVGKGGKAVPAKYVLPQLSVTDRLGESYDFTLYYEDGLMLSVIPVDAGDTGIEDVLNESNIEGGPRGYKRAVVRKQKAAVREGRLWRWSYSEVVRRSMAEVKWLEESRRGVWLWYDLSSYELDTQALIEIADEMVTLRTRMTGKKMPPASGRYLPLEPAPSTTTTRQWENPDTFDPEATP